MNEVSRLATFSLAGSLVKDEQHTQDANGNRIRSGEFKLSFDVFDRLVRVERTSDGATVGRYRYDALGRRVDRMFVARGDVAGAQQQVFHVSDGAQEVEEIDGAGNVVADYVWGGLYLDQCVQVRRNGQEFYLHTNSIFSAVAATNASGQVVERYAYSSIYGVASVKDAAGADRGSSEEIGNPWRFQGRRFDQETGFYYFRLRYLDPGQGRFVNRDPIGVWGDAGNLGNGYSFCGNDPVNCLDPFGLDDGDPFAGIDGLAGDDAYAEECYRRALQREFAAEGGFYVRVDPRFVSAGGTPDIGPLTLRSDPLADAYAADFFGTFDLMMGFWARANAAERAAQAAWVRGQTDLVVAQALLGYSLIIGTALAPYFFLYVDAFLMFSQMQGHDSAGNVLINDGAAFRWGLYGVLGFGGGAAAGSFLGTLGRAAGATGELGSIITRPLAPGELMKYMNILRNEGLIVKIERIADSSADISRFSPGPTAANGMKTGTIYLRGGETAGTIIEEVQHARDYAAGISVSLTHYGWIAGGVSKARANARLHAGTFQRILDNSECYRLTKTEQTALTKLQASKMTAH